MTSSERYRPVVLNAIAQLEAMGEYTYGSGYVHKLDWWTAYEVFDHIHGHLGQPHWRVPRTSRVPSPGRELVVKIINELRREGVVEYDPNSLGQTSRWRTIAAE